MNDTIPPAARPKLGRGVRIREVWAWSMYDFANSGYTTVVITAVFSAYFVSVVAGNADWATLAWTAALSASYAAIMFTAPLVGAWADARAAKKLALAITTLGCVICTALLWFAGPGALLPALLLVFLSNYFFGSGENLIAAFLPELADSEAMGRVSGWGWSLGYLGGLFSLGASLAWITWAQGQGQTAAQFVPVSMLITAGLFALASLPTFLLLRERARPDPQAGQARAGLLWRRVRATLTEAGQYRDLRRFLLCTVFYQAGIQAVITLAAIYAQQAMKFDTQQTIVLILVVNVAAAAGAFAFGYLQDAIGHVRAVSLTLAGWLLMVLMVGLSQEVTAFWAGAFLAGLCMGSAQAAGRAMVGVLAPAHRLAEFFGLWGLAVKLASIVGPLSYGVVTWVFEGNHRGALMFLGVYFVAGLVLLRSVDMTRGAAAARSSGNMTEV
jgi:UMF1 family MFS transporter